MKLKTILYMLMILPLLWGCNNEDDVDEIFASGTWYAVNYFGKADWNKRNGEPKYKPTDSEGRKALEIIQTFTLTFKTDGTFTGNTQSANFAGTWQADGDKRTVRLNIDGNPGTSSGYDKEFIESLKSAEFYNGDSNYLMLGPADKKSYIQFKHNN